MIFKKFSAALVGIVMAVSFNANAGLITQQFNNGDSLTAWGVDRATPSSFSIINNELVMSIAGPSQNNPFLNTQGMRLDIGQSNFMSIDMYIDSAWSNAGRYGGFWAVAYNNSNSDLAYPILEFQRQNSGNGVVASWRSSYGWANYSTLFNVDAFNTFSFKITNSGVQYSINGTNIYTDSTTNINYFGKVILNAQYHGNDFVVKYDNLKYGTIAVPEPSTLAIFALGIMGLVSRRSLLVNKKQ